MACFASMRFSPRRKWPSPPALAFAMANNGNSASRAIRGLDMAHPSDPFHPSHGGPRRNRTRTLSSTAEVPMHGGGLELALVFLLAGVLAVPVFKRFGLGAV